jgi:hypothetical protein
MSKPSPLLRVGCAALFGVSMTAQAQSISPSSVTQTINVGETFTINKTITLGATGATNVDVFFLADNTGSMGSTVASAKAGASAILNALPSTYQFGVGRYFGDPSEGVLPANSFQQLTSLTSSKPAVQTGINAWTASGGGDIPEGNFYALKQVADTAAWRPDAQRLVVWFGDASSHTETTTQAQAIAALQGANAKVVAFNNTVAGAGIDGLYAGQPSGTRQASDIISAVGGSLTNSFLSVSNSDFITAVTNQIALAASSVNLAFGSTFAGSGLSLAFACTDILGCNNVGAGQSRTFDLSITGLLPGTYNFNVFAQGIGAIETDSITVLSTAAIPEPSTYALFLGGLAAVGAFSRRRSGKALRT